MGAYWTAYLGVYMEVQESEETVVEKHYIDHNGVKQTTPFDPQSGAKHQEITKEVNYTIYPSPHGFEDIPDDLFFNPEYSGAPEGWITWLPDSSKYRLAKLGQHEDNPNQAIEEINILKLRSQFVEDHSDYLQKIGEKFNFVVKFGLVYYAH